MLEQSYKKLFWGFILVLFDFKLQYIDILPDIIGYIMAVNALGQLASHHKLYAKARGFLYVPLFLSIFDIYQPPNPTGGFTPTVFGVLMMLVGLTSSLFKLAAAYYIFQALMDVALEKGLSELGETAHFRCRLYLIANFIYLFIWPFTINLKQDYLWVMFACTIPMFIAELLFLGLINQARKALGEDEGSGEPPKDGDTGDISG